MLLANGSAKDMGSLIGQAGAIRRSLALIRLAATRDAILTALAFKAGRERYAGMALVLLVHGLVVFALIFGLYREVGPGKERDIAVAFVDAGDSAKQAVAAPVPELVSPNDPSIDPPEIAITNDAPGGAVGDTSAITLAPRPDPAHFNAPPQMPSQYPKPVTAIALVLRILVRPDGGIADATVTKSSGLGDLDNFAIAYVKANWRFIPAMMGDRAVQNWTTVFVPFAPSGA